MGYYKYTIEHCESGYFFQLLPNNNNSQYVGKSDIFSCINSCQSALEKFKNSYLSFRENDDLSEVVKKDNKYHYKFTLNAPNNYFYTRGYDNPRECENGKERVMRHISAATKIID